MKVYRITSKKFAHDISGTGAAIYGGRWNKKGSAVLYTGESKEIALLETIVHIPPMLIPDLDILTFEIPDDSITTLNRSDLPSNWKDYPAPTILAQLGEYWFLNQETIALKVPSCIIQTSHNYILNCQHKEYNKVKLISHEDFHFDARLNS
ncbi:RES family NAD+ phosphorylase [Kordia jejudonensis]|uniref:RES family NAD+ phosphorylase n=1 Tax=Kordia jejudonensis TaxID=1348245 RepID=UPI000629860F|nr:RES family NAD+ phosphorylase [Kordia jejudonensis]